MTSAIWMTESGVSAEILTRFFNLKIEIGLLPPLSRWLIFTLGSPIFVLLISLSSIIISHGPVSASMSLAVSSIEFVSPILLESFPASFGFG